MSLWWARRDQLDEDQLTLIEQIPLRQNCLILGPPGSGKTNVLLRRAQFVRSQDMPNVLVLTFTRCLTEFIKTGCYDSQKKEIFPPSCVMTIEGWLRWLYAQHGEPLPDDANSLIERKRALATTALAFQQRMILPKFDALFVDEAQDLLAEEVTLLSQWSSVLWCAGDSRQKLFREAEGLTAVRSVIAQADEHVLVFHYRLAPEICSMADRILAPESSDSLQRFSHYDGPKPGEVASNGPLTREAQLELISSRLKDQVRVYGDLINQGDRLGVIVARTNDRETVHEYLEKDEMLRGKSQIIRARGDRQDRYDPSLNPDSQIYIATISGCKGLEFRAVHWPFCEELSYRHDSETYYTVVTRAKTSLNLYYSDHLPQTLARAHAEGRRDLWS